MSRCDTRSEPRLRAGSALLVSLALGLVACPFSDNYAIDDGLEGGGGVALPTSASLSTGTGVGGADPGPCDPSGVPPGGPCPSECSSCAGAMCIIECNSGDDSCKADALLCPAGFDCELHCNAKDACKDASLSCPAGYDCHVLCQQDEACKDLDVLCNGGSCVVSCNTSLGCKDTQLACGQGDVCSCEGFAQPLQTSGCESACSCAGCE